MTETNKMRDLLATLRDALQKLEANLGPRGTVSTRSPARQNASVRVSKRWANSGSVRTPLSG